MLNRQVRADGFCMQTGNTEETDLMPSVIRVCTTLLILSLGGSLNVREDLKVKYHILTQYSCI